MRRQARFETLQAGAIQALEFDALAVPFFCRQRQAGLLVVGQLDAAADHVTVVHARLFAQRRRQLRVEPGADGPQQVDGRPRMGGVAGGNDARSRPGSLSANLSPLHERDAHALAGQIPRRGQADHAAADDQDVCARCHADVIAIAAQSWSGSIGVRHVIGVQGHPRQSLHPALQLGRRADFWPEVRPGDGVAVLRCAPVAGAVRPDRHVRPRAAVLDRPADGLRRRNVPQNDGAVGLAEGHDPFAGMENQVHGHGLVSDASADPLSSRDIEELGLRWAEDRHDVAARRQGGMIHRVRELPRSQLLQLRVPDVNHVSRTNGSVGPTW